MGRAAVERGYEYLAICDHTPAVGAVRGLTADDVRRQGEEIAAANEALAPFRVLRGIECDILPDGRLDLPDDVLAELDWVQASVHGGQRMPRREMTEARRGGAAQPVRALPQPSDGPAHQPPARERARPRARVRGRARGGVALEVNGLPARLDLRGEHVRDALRAGVQIVCSTDAHSVARAREHGARRSRTARRGWATRRRRPQHAAAGAILGRAPSGSVTRHAALAPGTVGPWPADDAQVLELAGREVRITSPGKVLFARARRDEARPRPLLRGASASR